MPTVEVCPEPEFQKWIKEKLDSFQKCLNNKISWTMAGVVVSIISIIAFISFSAYSGEQSKQNTEISHNTEAVNQLKVSTEVIKTQLGQIKEEIKEAKNLQKINFEIIIDQLKEIKRKGGEER